MLVWFQNNGENKVNLDERLDLFVRSWQNVINEHYAKDFPSLTPPILRVLRGSKFAKIIKVDARNPDGAGSVGAFVALVDFSNKALGAVKAGDIHKPASYAQPAKHARGSVFNDNVMDGMTEYGPVYLR